MRNSADPGRRRRPHKVTAITLVLGIGLALLVAGEAIRLTGESERRTLGQEATIEASAVSSLLVTVKGAVDSTVAAAEATNGDSTAFKQVAPGYFGTWVLQRSAGPSWATSLVIGQPKADVAGPGIAAQLDGVADGKFAVIGFFGTGATRVLAVAERRGSYRLYGEIGLPEQVALDPRTGAVAGSLPNLDYALYTDSSERRDVVTLTDTRHLPLTGRRAVVDVDPNTAGGAGKAVLGTKVGHASIHPGDLLLVTAPSGPLSGGFAEDFPWILLAVAIIATFAVSIAVEMILRRRDEALATVAQLQAQNDALDRAMEERSQMESQLRAAHRLEVVGKLAGGIAHDFNNLLAVILNYATFAVEQLDGHPARADIDEVVGAARRAAELTRQLLVFSRQDIVEPRIIDLNTVVTGMERLLERTLGEDLVLNTTLAPDLARVNADEGELEQVLMNLVVNARDAMSRGGVLTIATDNVALGPDEARHHPDLGAGRYVRLVVRDTGVGIPDSVLTHVFEPFFTTKEPGEGTGLGLATVYGIVTRWGGEVSVTSAVGSGSEFTVLLPASDERVSSAVEPDLAGGALEPKPVGTRVLIVEDEPGVRRAARRILEGAGYVVVESESGADALRRDDLGDMDVVLTDVIMPGGVSGRDLASHMSERHPGVRVLFMSGYTADVIAHRGVLDEGITLLDKPFTSASLLDAVAAVGRPPMSTSGAEV